MSTAIAGIILLTLCPALLISWWSASTAREEMINRASRRLSQAAQFGVSLYNQSLLAVERSLDLPDLNIALVASNREACQNLLRRQIEAHPYLLGTALVARNGRILCDSTGTGHGIDLSDRPYLQQALRYNSLIVGEPVVERIRGTVTVPLARQIRSSFFQGEDNNEPAFIIGAFNIREFVNKIMNAVMLADFEGVYETNVLLVDSANTVLWGEPLSDIIGTPVHILLAPTTVYGSAEIHLQNGRRYLAGISEWMSGNLRLIVLEPLDTITGPAEERFRTVLVAVITIAFTGASLASLLAHRLLVRPLNQLAAASQHIERADEPKLLTQPAAFRELEALRLALHRMAQNVRQREQHLVTANAELDHLARTDPLTGLANRRAFDTALSEHWERCLRDQSPLALILIDIDFFKLYNDMYGHIAGDSCLARVGRVIAQAAKRRTDMAARLGGEEFAILLPGADKTCAICIAEDVRSSVETLCILHGGSPTGVVTISAGVASIVPGPAENPTDFLRKADRALYDAKAAGKNSVSHGQARGSSSAPAQA